MAGIRSVLRPVPDASATARPTRSWSTTPTGWTRCSYIPFLRDVGRAFLGQPHADLRQREAAAGPRAAADLPRIQLHDPAGLRLPGAGAAGTAARCRWAARTSGATSSTASSSAGATDGARAVRPDHAADHHRVGRQDGQDRARAPSGSTPTGCRPTTTGSSGATPRTPMSAASCACSPTCRWTRSRGWRRCGGAEINEAKKVLATEATALAHGRARRRGGGRDRAPHLRGGRRRRATCPRVDVAARRARRRHSRLSSCSRAPASPRSNGEARRLIKGGGARLNDAAVTDETPELPALADLGADGVIKLSAGKKRHALIVPV